MSKFRNKGRRYLNIFRTLNNWGEYFWQKIIGFSDYFEFDIKDFGRIKVAKNAFGPFRENFFDNVYLSRLPKKHLAKSGAVIIDIGANIGYFSLNLLSKYPDARIIAFEPHPYCFEQLQQYQVDFSGYHLKINKKAVGGEMGTLVLYASKLDGFASMSSIYKSDSRQDRFEIESITLESVIENEKLGQVDLVKLDCEGSEYPILYSTPDHILGRINSLCVETHLGSEENENLSSLVEFLKSKKFYTEFLDEGKTGYIWAWK